MDCTDDRGTTGPSTDVSAVACVSAISCDFRKVSPKGSTRYKNFECFHISPTKRKTKSNHTGD